MLLWLDHSYVIRILTFQVKINFSPGLSLQVPKPRRRTKRTIVHDFKCLVGFFLPLSWFWIACLAAVKYETKTQARQKNISDATLY